MRNAGCFVALCTTAVCLGIPLTTTGSVLRLSAGSTLLLFAGCACGTQLGGRFANRFPPACVLFGGCLGIAIPSIALPLWSQTGWVLAARFALGVGIGIVFVTGAWFASLPPRALLVQGPYGGAVQLGAGPGVLLPPQFLPWFNWQGICYCWALLSLVPVTCWGMLAERECVQPRQGTSVPSGSLLAALRLPVIWKLGVIHVSTFVLGTGIALFLERRAHLPLATAATLG